VASWKGPRVGDYRRAPRRRALMQPSGCFTVRTTLVSKSLSVFEDKWRPGKPHASGDYRPAPRRRTLMQPEGCGPLGGSTDGRLGRTAAFRLLHRSDDLGIQIALRVRRQVPSWKGPRVGDYRPAPRPRALMQPEGCGPLGGSTDDRLRRTAAFRAAFNVRTTFAIQIALRCSKTSGVLERPTRWRLSTRAQTEEA
jgi:hypothetical protein